MWRAWAKALILEQRLAARLDLKNGKNESVTMTFVYSFGDTCC
jgi:hypothetical protein